MNIQTLRLFTTAYLLLPNLLFFWYWTRPVVAVFGIALLVYVFVVQLFDKEFESFTTLSRRDIGYVGSLSMLLTVISGVGGLCYQTSDYWCHNAKFYELYINDWPMRIPETGPVVAYYYGYYTVPALFSRFLGSFSEVFIFFWTLLGISLGTAWVYLGTNKKIIYLLICLFIGYSPRVIKEISSAFGVELYVYKDFVVDFWPVFENLFWAPNQVIPSLIMGGMLAYIFRHRIAPEKSAFVVTLSFWWAFFPAFASSLFVAVGILRKWISSDFALDWSLVVRQVALPVLASLPLLLMLTSHSEFPISGFIGTFREHKPDLLIEYGVNIGINLVIFLLFWQIAGNANKKLSFPFFLALLLLLIFSFFRIGKLNDFMARGPMPLLIVIGICLLEPLSCEQSYRAISQFARKSVYHFILLLLLFSSSLVALRRLGRALQINALTAAVFPNHVTFKPVPYDAYPNIYEVLKDRWSIQEANQYLGSRNSVYEKYISKTP